MAKSTDPPSSDQLAQYLPSDLLREAADALRGYDWQRWLTVERWLGLTGEEALWIEWGEDITIATEGEARTIQAKDVSKTITLGQRKTRDLISEALLRDPAVRTIIWTRAQPAFERGKPFGEPGIIHWRKVVAGETPADKLKEFLTTPDRLSSPAAAVITQTPDSALPDLFAKLEWVTGEPPITGLRERVLPLVEARLIQLGIPSASIVRDNGAERLFVTVAEVGTRENRAQRRLTRVDLDHLLYGQNYNTLVAAAPALQTAIMDQTRTRPDIADALERDLTLRYQRALQRSLFPEVGKTDELYLLAQELVEGSYAVVSPALRRRIFLRAARSSAVRAEVASAECMLSAALALQGPESELPAKARVLAAGGDTDGAIRLLRDRDDADSRSTLLGILVQNKDVDAALAWLGSNKLTAIDLTPHGVFTLCQIYLRKEDFDGLLRTHLQTTKQQCDEGPYLLFLRGVVRFASVIARSDWQMALTGIPLDARFAHPVLRESEVSTNLDAAIADLQRLQPIANELDLREAVRIAEAYVWWCELLHPGRKQAALVKLRSQMGELRTALPHVQFALAYDPEFDPKPLASLLENREALGGLDDDELRAAMILRLHGDDPRVVAEFIGKYRSRLEAGLGHASVLSIEIQTLAMARDATSARLLLDKHRDLLPSEIASLLGAEIAKAEGSDPVTEHKRVYEKAKTPEALRALVGALIAKKDRVATARYAEELYGQTDDPADITMAARALASVGDDENFLRVVTAYPFVEDRDLSLARNHAWLLFRLGRLKEAKRLAEALRQADPKLRDLDLEIAIAIESGEWETLGATLTAYLDSAPDRSGLELIRAAQLAHASGQGPMKALMDVAVKSSPNDPNVLLGAYTLVIEEGEEDSQPEVAEWFNRALDLSGPDGPIKRFELKEIVAELTKWKEHSSNINDAIFQGNVPLFIAAPMLGTTLVDMVLRNFVRNSMLADPRRRTAIPLFSGRRAPASFADANRIALDVSALMTLSWLRLLPKVIETYPEILIPAGALSELFEGRQKTLQFQKSRLVKAKQLKDAIASGRLQVKRSAVIRDRLNEDIGAELATLIQAAVADDGIVVRPSPVHPPGMMDVEADLSAHATLLADMRSLLSVLVDRGAVGQLAEETAGRYFDVQDKGWPIPAIPAVDRPLFLDGLAVVYLQSVGLLDPVLATFPSVYVDASTEEEASSLLEFEEHTNEVLRIIDDIRNAVCKGVESAKVVFGPRTSRYEDDEGHPDSSSMHLVANLACADIVVFDDRAMNKESFAADQKNHRARIATSLDIIDDLLGRTVLTENERRALLHRARLAGAVLVPVDAEEVTTAALRSGQIESSEFRAIRENIGIARLTELARFPAEIPWFASTSIAINRAITAVWIREPDLDRAAMLADAILDLSPNPEDWIVGWDKHPPADWIESITNAMTARLAFPVEIEDKKSLEAYNVWLERRVLAPMRATSPDRYDAIIDHMRSFIATASEDDDDEPAT